ncbi:cobaltochelatase CobN [Rhodobium orientis]|uniref:Cobaltochelatase subunit CobN n=1 Tax=Rhodobium orientis TaxID=34017 RepID=A0A327JT76_9HYPH|nr:cobaltochelatase subunit CobN [Rhodobium orientis]MBB4304703.1 cobaltochelatase CobN [Rhodobium orientis]MBK5952092.1 cobaltochelatase subunit CobN [Rhodobium orientis]RAI26508.1 cobaltochelatase subunit CobN [Rhodobium orientis]
MHLLVRESHSLEEAEVAIDLGQNAADIVVLSFSDSDLNALAAAFQPLEGALPSVRIANLSRLKHPMSVDLYVEEVIGRAKCVILRLLGGIDYWRYGVDEVTAACRTSGAKLVLLPGDGRKDERLAALSTVDGEMHARLDDLFAAGGPANMGLALKLAAHLSGAAPDPGGVAETVPLFGVHDLATPEQEGRPLAVLVFYRSYLLAGDFAPIEALADALDAEGLNARAVFVHSLKDSGAAAFVADTVRIWEPAVVINATGFSARLGDGPSPLDAAGVPVLQAVFAGSSREAWEGAARGLSQADLAMQVVLPELDGRVLATAVSFKAEEVAIPALQYCRAMHQPFAEGISLTVRRAANWARLAAKGRSERRLALILSDYPAGGGHVAHAVGLDTVASLETLTARLAAEGYDLGETLPDQKKLIAGLCEVAAVPTLSLDDYRALFSALPDSVRRDVLEAWGAPEEDPAVEDGTFRFKVLTLGTSVAAIQPDRGARDDRKATYHDPDLPPRHGYVAFYLWLSRALGIDAIVHLGTHGTLEWLPGKAVALSGACFPTLLSADLPVVYPFIVNNPGEAAVAKRRVGAVTVGHLTPPLKQAGIHGSARELERLVDEFAAADGLDVRRMALLRREILERAESEGLLAESGVTRDMSDDDALARLDAYLCDVKDLQIRDGLHIFGASPGTERRDLLLDALKAAAPTIAPDDLERRLDASPTAEMDALLAALDGRFVEPGPAGAPTRGRADVLPTGRNLFTIDPRAIPTRSALVLAEKAADNLLLRHLQEHGDWPRSLVIDLWGSTTMRTGGEDLALALTLMGVKPVWDDGSARVSGFEILPQALLDRPRIDVTVRISGVFRDAFESQIALLDAAIRAVAALDEPSGNPLADAARGLSGQEFRRATTRIFGAAIGDYGTGIETAMLRGDWQASADLGTRYIDASSFAYGKDLDGIADREGFSDRLRAADAFVHSQDHGEVDLLESIDYAAHEGGFAAAAEALGGKPALYHADTSKPDAPTVRTVAEEVARIVRGRAANPDWIAGMMRHGYRGASEIARTIDGLSGFAATVPVRFDRQFELLFDATLGDDAVDAFLMDANPAARETMADRFRDAISRDLWRPRRNSVAFALERDAS